MKDPRERFFDECAHGWEDRCYPPPTRERLTVFIEHFGIRPGERLLDMGTGTGVLHPYLARATGTRGRVLAFDLSFNMVSQAHRLHTAPNLLAVQADALHVPVADASVDRVICFAAFPHFRDKHSAMAEMARATKPGGTVLVAHLLSREELCAHHRTHPAVAHDELPDALNMRDLFLGAGLTAPTIVDKPGSYLAMGRRPALEAHA